MKFWFTHSIITVDRRDDRNKVIIAPSKIYPSARCFISQDKNITVNEKGKYQAHRYVYTKSVRHLHAKYVNDNEYVSRGIFHRLKPFSIQPPSERERESCLCIKCLNIHRDYNALRKHVSDIFSEGSLTQFLTSDMLCVVDPGIAFHRLECLIKLHLRK